VASQAALAATPKVGGSIEALRFFADPDSMRIQIDLKPYMRDKEALFSLPVAS
jgi:hypothetical protein